MSSDGEVWCCNVCGAIGSDVTEPECSCIQIGPVPRVTRETVEGVERVRDRVARKLTRKIAGDKPVQSEKDIAAAWRCSRLRDELVEMVTQEKVGGGRRKPLPLTEEGFKSRCLGIWKGGEALGLGRYAERSPVRDWIAEVQEDYRTGS